MIGCIREIQAINTKIFTLAQTIYNVNMAFNAQSLEIVKLRLTCIDEELAGDARVIHVVNGTRENGSENLQVREHILPKHETLRISPGKETLGKVKE